MPASSEITLEVKPLISSSVFSFAVSATAACAVVTVSMLYYALMASQVSEFTGAIEKRLEKFRKYHSELADAIPRLKIEEQRVYGLVRACETILKHEAEKELEIQHQK